jgi:hypothetical protein
VTTLGEGESATLASYGPFTLTARCDAEGTNTAANAFISSTEDHWAAGTYWNDGDGDLPAGTEYSIFEDYVSDAPGGDPAMYEGYYIGATAFTPSGRAIVVYLGDWANADTDSCKFWGHVVVDG